METHLVHNKQCRRSTVVVELVPGAMVETRDSRISPRSHGGDERYT